jgi:hypothetical protein
VIVRTNANSGMNTLVVAVEALCDSKNKCKHNSEATVEWSTDSVCREKE